MTARWLAPRVLWPRHSPGYLTWILISLAIWGSATLLQTRVAAAPWAMLDVVGHAAIVAACAGWLYPRWGLRPVLAAVVAATLIDLDHVVAARSFSPQQVATMSVRPVTHGLPAASIIAVGAGLAFGPRVGYATAVGLLVHILGDATVVPGVPLLVPVVADSHVLLSPSLFVAGVVVCSAANAVLAWPGRSRTGRRSPGLPGDLAKHHGPSARRDMPAGNSRHIS